VVGTGREAVAKGVELEIQHSPELRPANLLKRERPGSNRILEKKNELPGDLDQPRHTTSIRTAMAALEAAEYPIPHNVFH
jgi:hypothetical protein